MRERERNRERESKREEWRELKKEVKSNGEKGREGQFMCQCLQEDKQGT